MVVNIHRGNSAHSKLRFVDLSVVEIAPNGLLELPLPPFFVAFSVVVDVSSKEMDGPMESIDHISSVGFDTVATSQTV